MHTKVSKRKSRAQRLRDFQEKLDRVKELKQKKRNAKASYEARLDQINAELAELCGRHWVEFSESKLFRRGEYRALRIKGMGKPPKR